MFWGMSKDHTLFGAYLTSTGFLPLWFAGSERLEITAECTVWPQYLRSPCRPFWSEVVAQGTLKRDNLNRTRWRRLFGLPVRNEVGLRLVGTSGSAHAGSSCMWAGGPQCSPLELRMSSWHLRARDIDQSLTAAASWVEWGVNTSPELQLPFSLGRVLGYSFLLFSTYNMELG